MAVFRVEKTKDFTVMSNHHLRNVSLSLKAKGLLSLMLSLPDDWDYTTKGLAHICKDGVDSISSAIKELEKQGKGIDYADCVLLQKRQHNFWLYAAGRKGTTSCFFCRRTETGGGKIPIKKAGSWGQEKINIFLSWA